MLGYGKKKYLFAESLCKSIRKTKKKEIKLVRLGVNIMSLELIVSKNSIS